MYLRTDFLQFLIVGPSVLVVAVLIASSLENKLNNYFVKPKNIPLPHKRKVIR